MSIVDDLIDRVIQREGGFVNNAADRGGATKYGITIGTLRDWRHDVVGVDDVQKLTEDEARQIYRQRYFTASGFDQVPDAPTVELLFDFAVNSGIGAASMALQHCLGVKEDGVVGPISIAAIKAATNWLAMYYAIKSRRQRLLLRYIGIDNTQAVFALGWSNRLDGFERPLA